jgi:uncharacterized protein
MNSDLTTSSANTNETHAGELAPELLDELDLILDDLRTRNDEAPQWEFCEGFMVALICCRRAIDPEEYVEVLLGGGDEDEGVTTFANSEQKERFMHIWNLRWAQVLAALDTPIESLDEATAYHPDVMDVRGAVAELPQADRDAMAGEALPAFAQVWALGFMYAVEAWPEEWAEPSDKKAAKWHDLAMQAVVALTEDDTGELDISPFSEDGPPSMSKARLDVFADAVWAVYDLREIWRGIGPRVPTLRRADTPGRNDPCHCGSGKKYKKCHGA